jgi:hypothetical protein
MLLPFVRAVANIIGLSTIALLSAEANEPKNLTCRSRYRSHLARAAKKTYRNKIRGTYA